MAIIQKTGIMEQVLPPLGNNTNSFDGTFDGDGFTINNLTINLPTSDNVGLFGLSHRNNQRYNSR